MTATSNKFLIWANFVTVTSRQLRVCFQFIVLIFIFLAFIAQFYIFDSFYTSISFGINWKFRVSFGEHSVHQHQNQLLNITNFSFVSNTQNHCQIHKNSQSEPDRKKLLIIIIPSFRENFESRQLVRKTWGLVNEYNNWTITKVFLLGLGSESENVSIQLQINSEIETFSDIVLGGFVDSYKNMSYKHLMGYKWIVENCDWADFVLKVDDDVVVDIFQVIRYVHEINDTTSTRTVYHCAENINTYPARMPNKWQVTVEEYSSDKYPSYCGYAAYLTTVNVVHEIYLESNSQSVKYFWIDDVFVTGMLRESVNKKKLNPQESVSIVNTFEKYSWSWLVNATEVNWNPRLCFIIIVRGSSQQDHMCRFWKIIVNFHAFDSSHHKKYLLNCTG